MTGSAREVALVTLTACEKQGAWSDLALKKNIRAAGLDSRDAALATRLCFGVQQNRLLLDFYLSRFSTVKLERMERQVRNVLRLGIYQIAFLTKVPPSAAVHTSVELARRYSRNPRSPGLVNGILRSVARNAERLPVIGEQNPAAYLSIRYSHPLWLVQEWMSVLGPEETEALLAADNGRPPTAAQVNTIHFTVEYVVEALRAQGVEAALHPWMPDCLLLRATGDLEGLAPFQAGAFYIQDPAARAAVLAAGLEPGMRVLDACAAPGGKSFACAIAMEDRGGSSPVTSTPTKWPSLTPGPGGWASPASTPPSRTPRPAGRGGRRASIWCWPTCPARAWASSARSQTSATRTRPL